eukprot:GAHX01001839.1.p1 GENE.GAHX01001839.1~~GAHX01001839.1.p1  ORF type:complete len:109 (+),score=21.57 GAHX01001839.1:90-416(+)
MRRLYDRIKYHMASGIDRIISILDGSKRKICDKINNKIYSFAFLKKMNKTEALLILNVHSNSSKEAVNQNYRKLMVKLHPDNKGGSPYLSSKVASAYKILTNKSRNFE